MCRIHGISFHGWIALAGCCVPYRMDHPASAAVSEPDESPRTENSIHNKYTSEDIIMKFDQDNFDKEVLKSDIPVMVDFFAEWCGPCKMMGPVVEELEEEYKGKIKIGQLNVDDNPEIAERYSVMSIPNFIFFKNGQPVAQSIGGVPKATLEEKIKEVL